MPDLDEVDLEWEVEDIKAKETFKGIIYYLVKWAGWPAEYNQWVPEEDMTNCARLIERFESKRSPRGRRRHADEDV